MSAELRQRPPLGVALQPVSDGVHCGAAGEEGVCLKDQRALKSRGPYTHIIYYESLYDGI